ncbi:MAG: hypothetical protein FH758_12575 [Firmicutes bacterium]|nr:hypothetical protein [Bacillota bacterium]
MGLPKIPERGRKGSIVDIIESIALEETALAALINSEAEKVQAFAECLDCDHMSDIIDFQKSVSGVVQNAIKMQMLLQFKLEDVIDLIDGDDD